MTEKKEYIEREALLKSNMYGNTNPITHRTYAEQLIKSAPAADVAPVKHGEWKQIAVPFFGLNVPEAECTVCGESWTLDMRVDFEGIQNCWHYCPYCGAKMDGGKNG